MARAHKAYVNPNEVVVGTMYSERPFLRRALSGFAVAFVVLLLGVCAFGYQPAQAMRIANGHTSPVPLYGIYFVGDSLTHGRSATSESQTYRRALAGYLQSRLGNSYFVVNDSTTPGQTYYSGWRVADTLAGVRNHPPRPYTRLSVVEVGTNDVSANLERRGEAVTSLPTFTRNYNTLLSRVRGSNSNALVCLSVWWYYNAPWPYSLASRYDAAIRSACAAHGGTFVSLRPIFNNPRYKGPAGLGENWYKPGWRTDAFHPNNTGQAAIAQAIYNALISAGYFRRVQ